MARGRRTDPTAAVLVQVMHEMGLPSCMDRGAGTCTKENSLMNIIKGRGIWGQMPRNELYDRIRERLGLLIEQMAYSTAMKVMARLDAKIENASYMEAIQIADVLSRIWR